MDTENILGELENLRLVTVVARAHSGAAGPPQGYNYVGPHDYVLDRHQPAPEPQELDAEQREYLQRMAEPCGLLRPQQCFSNSMNLLWVDTEHEGRLQYVEGYFHRGLLPVLHGWLLLDGLLVDVTRSLRPEALDEFFEGKDPQRCLSDRVLGVVPEGWAYVGVPVRTAEVLEYMERFDSIGSRIDCPDMDYDLLRQERRSQVDWAALVEPFSARIGGLHTPL